VLKEQEDLTEVKERMDHQEDLELRDQTEPRENVVLKAQTDQLVDPVLEVVSDLQELSVNEDLKVQWEWLEVQDNQENEDPLVIKVTMVLVDQQVPGAPWEFQEMPD